MELQDKRDPDDSVGVSWDYPDEGTHRTQQLPPHEAIFGAARVLRHATNSYVPVEDWEFESDWARAARRLFYSEWFWWLRTLVVVANCVTSLIEEPYDCHPSITRAEVCTDGSTTQEPNMSVHILDLVLLHLLWVEILLCLAFQQKRMFLSPEARWSQPQSWCDWWRCSKLAGLLVSTSLVAVELGTHDFTGYWLRQCLKAVFLIEMNANTRATTVASVKLLPRILPTLLLIFGLMVVYGTITQVFVKGTDLPGSSQLEASEEFSSMGETLVSYFYLLTVATQPNVSYPAYSEAFQW